MWRRGAKVKARLTRNRSVASLNTNKVVSHSKKLYPQHIVLVGFRNNFERDFTIELIKLRALWKIDCYVK
mgnify:FL=1